MPYVYKEILEDTETEADVIERDILDSVADERDNAIAERDNAYAQIDSLQVELDNVKKKFADSFLNAQQYVRPENPLQKEDTVRRPVSYKSLFEME